MGSSPHEYAGQPQPEGIDVIQLPSRDSLDFPNTDSSTESDDDDSVDTAIYDGGPAQRTLRPAPLLINHRRFPPADEDDSDHDHDSVLASDDEIQEEKPVTWSSLPKKGQLAILTFARLSEPLTQTSLQAYMFYQLKSFDPSLPDSTISAQAGIMQGSFTAAQFLTAVWWGRLADTEWMGRKRVLLIGLLGTCISCLGFGFSRSFTAAIIFRTVGGVLNSNVGVMRTLIAEIIAEKNFPGLFGPGSTLGGKDGVWWMQRWPYALPNVLSAIFIFMSLLAVFLGLDETHEVARYRSDWGRKLGKRITRAFTRRPRHYRPLQTDDNASVYLDGSVGTWSVPSSPARSRTHPRPRPYKRPGFRQICTKNVMLTLLAHFLLAFHTSAFNAMTFVFLPTPRAPEGSRDGFFHFGGGLGLPSARVGLATAIIGFIGLPLQIFLYPRIQSKLGTLTSFRVFLPFSPISYMFMPFLVILPRLVWVVWPAFTIVVSLQVISRTFALPAAIILVNNCVTDPSVLGTVHGVAQSIASAARTLGPFLGGWGLGLGLANNMVGVVWWGLAIEAFLGWIVLWTIHEGKGIERPKEDNTDEDD
ncbi:hypothetical protein PENSUB_7929 [Penicillium subrubescens]|uniref:Major facilitator superfamily (MFS) profile domain-containing protein n=1 Tax=Penicillium subrubescens TaxID=1316194 RepID=A0A1Q5TJR8_9EURO|nr:hypothetical protein PENSUB_7929 [Penicillium subrubescens]